MLGRVRAFYQRTRGGKRRRDNHRRKCRRVCLEALEPRVVLSADLSWAFDVELPSGANDIEEYVHEPDLHVLSTDGFGNPFYTEPSVSQAAAGGGAAAAAGDDTLWQGYDLAETFSLHSKSDANHVIYLDFDGHVTSGTYWNDAFAGGDDIVTTSWSSDADDTSLSDSEKAMIQRIWARVSEDYAPFDVDVTTEEPPLADLMKSGDVDTKWGSRVVIGPNTWFSPAGGVAYVGSFNWSSDTPCFVFNTSESGVAEASSHEVGHTLGLTHDGDLSTAYYSGNGSGATSWGPIMGAPYGRTLTQWSQGEYLNASNAQDDVAIIASQNGFGYRADDYGDVFAEATPLLAAGATQIDTSYGVIEQSTDYDVFSFQAGSGAASISVAPLAIGPNLDVLAELYNSAGTLIGSSNPVDTIDADLSLSLPGEGTYFLRVSGTGKGDPLVEGYTDYGSLGNYRISGTVPSYSPGNSVPLNGSFESGLSDWETSGDVSAQTSAFGETPASGQNQALLTNVNSAGGNVTIANLETFLGLGSGVLDAVAPGTATAGSAIRQTVNVAAGQELTFQYNFVTNESTPDATYNDFSFFTVAGPDTAEALLLADTSASGFGTSGSTYKESTGYQEFSYSFAQSGVFTIGFGVSDSQDTSYDSALLIDAVSAGESSNTPPTAVNDNAATNEDNSTTIDVTANDTDADGDLLDVTGVTQGSWGTVALNANDTITYTPSANFNGGDTFTYTINDGNGGQATGTVTVTVNPENDTPVAANDASTTPQNTSVTVVVLTNDTDVDGDTLSVASVAQPATGSAVINGDNSITYTPADGFFGDVVFSYMVDDGQGGQATASVTVTVTVIGGFNLVNGGFEQGLTGWETSGDASTQTAAFGEIPVAGSYQGELTNANTLGGNISIADLETFLGLGGGTLDAVAAGTATAGSAIRQTVSVQAGTQLTFEYNFLTNEATPDSNYNDFSFFTVSGSGTAAAMLLADTQADGFASSASIYKESTGFRSYSYTFATAGQYTIGFGVSDSKDTSYDSGLLLDEVSLGGTANNPPVAVDDTAITGQNLPVTINVLSNDSDTDGGTLDVVSVTAVRNGTVVVNDDNTITYTPDGGYFGPDSFWYTIDDGQGDQATAEVTVTVTEPTSDVLNGGFEEDLLYWQVIGDASAQTNSLGEAPATGLKQGVICTANTYGGNIAVADLEMFLGLPAGAIEGVNTGTATAGSAIRQTITVSAGLELTFSYNFLTNENTPASNYNDFSFFSVVGPGVQAASLLADTYANQFGSSPSAYKESTGYRTFTYTFPQAGEYTIGFGVSDVRDTSYDSALLIDQVALQPSAAPEAAAPFDSPNSGGNEPSAAPAFYPSGSLLPDVFASGEAGSQQLSNKLGKQPQIYGGWMFGFQAANGIKTVTDEPDTADAAETSLDWDNLVDLIFAGW